jgi:hypothetical protein
MYEVGYSEAELKLKCKQARDQADPESDDFIKQGTRTDLEHPDNVKKSQGGNDTDYTLRRLARDKPELLDAIAVIAVLVGFAAGKVSS